MGTVAPFRIKGGLDLDGKVQFQVFPSIPSGTQADLLSVGSLAIAQDSGQWYRKTTIGAGPDKWAALLTSMDTLGIAPNWLSPVDAAITAVMTKTEAKTVALAMPNLPIRVLCANLSDATAAIHDAGFYPQAGVLMDPAVANPPGSHVYELRSTLPITADTSAGNDLTLELTTNNPVDATETTGTIVGNAIAVNLKNTAGTSTATMFDVVRALEAVDTDNRVRMHCPDFTAEQIAAGVDTLTPCPLPLPPTAFTGGSAARIGFEKVPVREIQDETRQNFAGDTVYVAEGAEKGSVYCYNMDQVWVKQGASNVLETGFIQTFVGKSGDGAELPTYSSNAIVTQSANLETAIGQLDAAEQDTRDFIGMSVGEEMPLYATTHVVEQGASLNEAISQLDLELSYLSAFMGKVKGNGLPVYASTRIVTQNGTLEEAISQLDDALGTVSHESNVTQVTTAVTADSILMEQEMAAEWLIHAREVANPGNVYFTRILAAHNAAIGLPATAAHFNESGIIELGQPIDGFAITMDVETSGPLNARTMRLRMASVVPVDVTLSRSIVRRAA
ncbi:MAG: hypothetical protein HQL76_06255 [Magnetococcales bacterium]|nr:hypothetical protein [Magnetococcales bacterium]